MIELFWTPSSSATRILWMLEEATLEYDLTSIDIRARPRRDPPAFRAISPLGKVPALRDGSVGLWGSAQICMYVADKYAPGHLAPAADEAARADYIEWIFFSPAALEPALMERFMDLVPNEEATGWGSFDHTIDRLNRRIDGCAWIVGDRFSAADVMICSSCELLLRFGLVQPSRAMSDYVARCASRPAYRRSKEIDETGSRS